MKHIYLIDTENVGRTFLDKLSILQKCDKVYIFYTANSCRIDFMDGMRLKNAVCSIEVLEVSNGTPNALDFQLVSYLGLIVKSSPKSYYHIVSNDSGFNASAKFLGCFGYRVVLESEITRVSPELADCRGLIEVGTSGTVITRADGVKIELCEILGEQLKCFIAHRVSDRKMIGNYFIKRGNTDNSGVSGARSCLLSKFNFKQSSNLALKGINNIATSESKLASEYNYILIKGECKKSKLLFKDTILRLAGFIVYESNNINNMNMYLNYIEASNKVKLKEIVHDNIDLLMNKEAQLFC